MYLKTILTKPLFVLVFIASSNSSNAGTAKCIIDIWDLSENTTYKVEYNFKFKDDGNNLSQMKEFKLPGSDYTCLLYFHDLNHGTSIACEYDKDLGQTYFLSDRTGSGDEKVINNNLRFRHKSAHIRLDSVCQ